MDRRGGGPRGGGISSSKYVNYPASLFLTISSFITVQDGIHSRMPEKTALLKRGQEPSRIGMNKMPWKTYCRLKYDIPSFFLLNANVKHLSTL